jgi:putative oxidoreductase
MTIALPGPLGRLTDSLNRASDTLLPLLARLVFAAVLFRYFWGSALTKVGDGIFGVFQPGVGAYSQIYPKALEAAGYDPSQLGHLCLDGGGGGDAGRVHPAGADRARADDALAAVGMIGFVVVQSLTDIVGHMADAATVGALFDRASGSLIMDQRTLWVMLFLVLVLRGGGALSVDRLLFRSAP